MATKIKKISQNAEFFYPVTISEAVIVDASTNLKVKLAAQDAATTKVATDLAAVKTSIGKASGIAPLGTDSKIAAQYLPSYVDDVVELVCVGTDPTKGKVGDMFYNENTSSKWNTDVALKTMIKTVATVSGNADISTVTTKQPEADKIYISIATSTTYRWSGTTMVQLDAGLVIGTTAGTAFDGARGLAVEVKNNTTTADLGILTGTVDALEENVQDINGTLELHKDDLNNLTNDVTNIKMEYVTAINMGVKTYIDIPPTLFP